MLIICFEVLILGLGVVSSGFTALSLGFRV